MWRVLVKEQRSSRLRDKSYQVDRVSGFPPMSQKMVMIVVDVECANCGVIMGEGNNLYDTLQRFMTRSAFH